jgi:hypothetical protein
VTFGFAPLGFRVKLGAGRNGVVNRCVGVGTDVGTLTGTSVAGAVTGASTPATTSAAKLRRLAASGCITTTVPNTANAVTETHCAL